MIRGESSTSQATMASSPQTKKVTSKKLLIRGESSTSQATMASSPQTKKPTSKKADTKEEEEKLTCMSVERIYFGLFE